jgi:hypothetical protein
MNKAKFNTIVNSEQNRTNAKQKLARVVAIATLSLSLASCGTAENAKADSDPTTLAPEPTATSSIVEAPTTAPTQAPEIQTNSTPESIHEWLNSEPQPLESATVTPNDGLFIIQIPGYEDSDQIYAIGNTIEWKEAGEEKVFSTAVATSLEGTQGNAATFADEEVLQQAVENGGTVTVWATPLPKGSEDSINQTLSGGIPADTLAELQNQVLLYDDLNSDDQKQVDNLYSVLEEFEASEL